MDPKSIFFILIQFSWPTIWVVFSLALLLTKMGCSHCIKGFTFYGDLNIDYLKKNMVQNFDFIWWKPFLHCQE